MKHEDSRWLALSAVLALVAVTLVALPLESQEPPPLPSWRELIEARRAVLAQASEPEIRRLQIAADGNGWLRKLVLDNLSGSYSYGRGITIASEDEHGTLTQFTSQKTTSTWNITYKVPLVVLFDNLSGRSGSVARLELEIAQAERRQAALVDELELRRRHDGFLEARADYVARRGATTATDRGARRRAAFAMRRQATALLLLAGLEDSRSFASWEAFRPEEPADETIVASN